jgi:hypothetical protein
MYPTTSPVGKTSQVTYNAGMDPEIMKLFGQIMLNGDRKSDLTLLKKGSKLISRQK